VPIKAPTALAAVVVARSPQPIIRPIPVHSHAATFVFLFCPSRDVLQPFVGRIAG
jgi:hypothetical protein